MKNTLKMHYSLPSGETAYFNTSKLKSILLRKSLESEKEGKKRSQQALMMDIADKIGVSSSAIKHWMLGHNAPSDLEKVTDLADMGHIFGHNWMYNVEMELRNLSVFGQCGYHSIEICGILYVVCFLEGHGHGKGSEPEAEITVFD